MKNQDAQWLRGNLIADRLKKIDYLREKVVVLEQELIPLEAKAIAERAKWRPGLPQGYKIAHRHAKHVRLMARQAKRQLYALLSDSDLKNKWLTSRLSKEF